MTKVYSADLRERLINAVLRAVGSSSGTCVFDKRERCYQMDAVIPP